MNGDIINQIPTIKTLIEYIFDQSEQYLHTSQTEEYIVNDSEPDYDDEILRGEGILDRLNEMNSRNEILIEKTHELVDRITLVMESILRFQSERERERNELGNKINAVIDTLIAAGKAKMESDIEPLRVRTREIKDEYRERKSGWSRFRIETKEYREERRKDGIERHHEYLDEKEYDQLEEWTRLRMGDVVFDSNKGNWAKNTSEFEECIIGNSRLLFLIEDTKNNKFGGYVEAKIDQTDGWIEDVHAFLFSLKSNGRLDGMSKFEIAHPQTAFKLFDKSNTFLCDFGDGSDIRIFKEKNKSLCNQSKRQSYNYHGIESALLPNSNSVSKFVPKRIVVIQMD